MGALTKTLLLTGAAGGLGRALVRELAPRYRIVAVDVDAAGLEAWEGDPGVETFVCDLRDARAIRDLRRQLDERSIRIHTLINNAGVSDFFPVSEAPAERLDRILEVNTLAPVRTVSVFLDHLAEQKGRVIQISSESVKRTGLFQPYSASKIAMEAFSRILRQELSLLEVDLVLIRPGAIRTNLLRGLENTVSSNPDSRYRSALEAFLQNARGMVGRQAAPERIAEKIARVVDARRPKKVYHFDNNPLLTLFAALPESWSDRIVRQLVRKKG